MRTFVSMTLLFSAIGGCDMPDDLPPINVETPEGTVTLHRSIADPVPQQIMVVAGYELKRLQRLGAQAPSFVTTYLPDTSGPDLMDYDRAFRAWGISDSPQHSDEQTTEILGGYLGNRCVADLDMEWVTVTDKHGTNYAVRSKKSEVMAFPFSTALKRIEDKEYDFLYGVYHVLKEMISSGDYKSRDSESSSQ